MSSDIPGAVSFCPCPWSLKLVLTTKMHCELCMFVDNSCACEGAVYSSLQAGLRCSHWSAGWPVRQRRQPMSLGFILWRLRVVRVQKQISLCCLHCLCCLYGISVVLFLDFVSYIYVYYLLLTVFHNCCSSNALIFCSKLYVPVTDKGLHTRSHVYWYVNLSVLTQVVPKKLLHALYV